MVALRWHPLVATPVPLRLADHLTVGSNELAGEVPNFAVEADVRKLEAERDSQLFGNAVPAIQPALNLFHIVITQSRIQRSKRGHALFHYASILHVEHGIVIGCEPVIIAALGLFVAAL